MMQIKGITVTEDEMIKFVAAEAICSIEAILELDDIGENTKISRIRDCIKKVKQRGF